MRTVLSIICILAFFLGTPAHSKDDITIISGTVTDSQGHESTYTGTRTDLGNGVTITDANTDRGENIHQTEIGDYPQRYDFGGNDE